MENLLSLHLIIHLFSGSSSCGKSDVAVYDGSLTEGGADSDDIPVETSQTQYSLLWPLKHLKFPFELEERGLKFFFFLKHFLGVFFDKQRREKGQHVIQGKMRPVVG